MNPKKLFKDKVAELDELVKTILWIVLFIILAAGVYFLIKFLTTT